jgi:hypothetical protein
MLYGGGGASVPLSIRQFLDSRFDPDNPSVKNDVGLLHYVGWKARP